MTANANTVVERNYPFSAAGRVWVVPEFHTSYAKDGTLGVTATEFRRVHLAIVCAVCGQPGPLTAKEFEFLCDIADVPYAQIAERVGLDRSALTKWMQSNSLMRVDRSNLLKRWFLITLFGDALRGHALPIEVLAEDATVLLLLRDEILRRGATFDIVVAVNQALRHRTLSEPCKHGGRHEILVGKDGEFCRTCSARGLRVHD